MYAADPGSSMLSSSNWSGLVGSKDNKKEPKYVVKRTKCDSVIVMIQNILTPNLNHVHHDPMHNNIDQDLDYISKSTSVD